MTQEDVTKLAVIQDDIDKVSLEISKLSASLTDAHNELVRLQTKLVKECNHPTVKRGSEYFEGGYDYVSRTEYYTECTICKRRDITKVDKGYFQ